MKIQGKRIMSVKNKIIWFSVSLFATVALAIVIIPPMINLNFLKPKIENIISTQTGISAKINGDINFSLLGRTHIVAHDISVEKGKISTVDFAIPFFDIFDMKNAKISGDIKVYGASLLITKIVPFNTDTTIIVDNSNIKFLNKEYNIINANISKNNIDALVRTDQHKYEIKLHDNLFNIKNKNNNLKLSGELFKDGTANAHIEIIAQDINRWFEFDKPRITGHFPVIADINWDGKYGVDFYNISANGITGSADLQNDGYKIIKLESKNADYDLSFFLKNPEILKNASFDLNFYGKLKFMDKTFSHVEISTVGSEQEIKINKIITDDMQITGGYIDENGAHDLHVSIPENGVNTTCIFDGTPIKWSCNGFSYGKALTGKIFVDKNTFSANIYSHEKISDINSVIKSAKRFGNVGIIKFDFPDMAGTIKINHNEHTVKYEFARNKNLTWANIDVPFITKNMLNENGDFVWEYDSVIFIPKSESWQFAKTKDFFTLNGKDFKQLFPDIDLQSLNNFPYAISGNYKNNTISNLTLEINNHKFSGSFANNLITLKTSVLDIDSFVNPEFIDNYEQLSFLVAHPLTIPFDSNINIAISTDAIIYDNQKYNNFIYSKHDNIQNFSITDSKHGNLLATITKNKTKYALNIQLNKFITHEKLLPEFMPLNISDTMITAEINLKTSGIIAHDIIDNMHGTFDASFDGGKLYGIGTDNFYATASDITTLNVEQRLSNALSNGITDIKKMHIVGVYENGDIKTVQPFTLQMKHVDVTGILDITNNEIFAKLKLNLRGTSSGIEPIDLIIYPNNKREFSLSEIMMHFDAEYMRTFIKTHNQF